MTTQREIIRVETPVADQLDILYSGQEQQIGMRTAANTRRRVTWAVVALLLAAIACLFLIRNSASRATSAAANAMHQQAVPVVAARAKIGDLDRYLTALGSVTAFYTVTVKTQVNGQLVTVNFKEGQLVREGDLLAQVDPRPYQAALEQAQGQLAKDKASAVYARHWRAINRLKKRFGRRVIAVLSAAEHFETSHRDGGDKSFFHACRIAGGFEVGEITAQCLIAAVCDWAKAARPRRRARNAQGILCVEFGKFALLPSHSHDAHRPASGCAIWRFGAGRSWPKAGQAIEDVGAPSRKIRRGTHRLAELAIIGNVDADVQLLGDDV